MADTRTNLNDNVLENVNLSGVIGSAFQILNEDPNNVVYENEPIKRGTDTTKRKFDSADEHENEYVNKVRLTMAEPEKQGTNLPPKDQASSSQSIHTNGSQQEASEINSNNLPKRPPYYVACKDNIYNSQDKGPFVLYVESINSFLKIHPMSLGKLIRENCLHIYKDIFSISKIDKFKIKIILSKFNYANDLKNESIFKNNNLICYVPTFMLTKKGLVRDVDYSLSDQEILEFIDAAGQEVLSARRIFKKKGNESVPTPLVILQFRGQSLPKEIKLLNVMCKVDPFIEKVSQCRRCLRYGHLESRCMYPHDQRCPRCGGKNHLISDCPNDICCVYCKRAHLATDQRCPEFEIQVNIRSIMSENNFSFLEAKKHLLNKDSYSSKINQKNELASYLNNFPPLTVSQKGSEIFEIPTINSYAFTNKNNNNNNSNVSSSSSRIVHVERAPRSPPRMQQPYFQHQQNISNNLLYSNTPIIDNEKYKININSREEFINFTRVLADKIVSNQTFPINNELSLEERKKCLINIMADYKNVEI